jgi:predicted nicotinamide N-methyase
MIMMSKQKKDNVSCLRVPSKSLSIFIFLMSLSSALALVSPLTGFSLHKVKLRNNDSSPYCFAATVDPTKEAVDIKYNFLATQVWPSARQASFVLEKYVDRSWVVCEFGCGPALPSLIMAGLDLPKVIATDLDMVALDMVEKAANEQGFDNLVTMRVDLTAAPESILEKVNADLYIMSDVFENGAVAKGAALFTIRALEAGSRVWTFAQSDRAQREVYLRELECLGAEKYGSVTWKLADLSSDNAPDEMLLLFDLDEVNVNYG